MRIVILGAGGHGAVVRECLQAAGVHEVVGFLDDDVAIHGREVIGLGVLGAIAGLERLPVGVEGVALGVGANQTRLRLLALARDRGLTLPTIIHPRAWVSPSATCGAGTVVNAGAVVNARARLGAGCIVNTGASVDHDGVVGDGVHLAPGARLAGGVEVGSGSFIGMNAAVIEGLRLGSRCMVAAGAVVIGDVADDLRVGGVPAKPLA